MRHPTIVKARGHGRAPILEDYELARAEFTWDAALNELELLDERSWNIAHEAVDRHAHGSDGDRLAIRWIGRRGRSRDLTYRTLSEDTSRLASALRSLGVGVGERVFTVSPRLPEFYVSAIAALKNGSVLAPLFSAFGPEPIATRMRLGRGAVLVTTPRLYRRKIEPIRDLLEDLREVIVIPDGSERPAGTIDFDELIETGDPDSPAEPMEAEDLALLHFTSGTTGTPKGAMHVHRAALHHLVSARFALDLSSQDVFWCTADPGWVTGTSYGLLAPLLVGATNIVDEGEFDADRWYGIVQNQAVTVWYTAPTAIRMLMKVGSGVAKEYDLSSLRFVASVGEPLNPEGVEWGLEAFGTPIHDNWWQTETGGIMIANYAGEDVKPGSMGRPLPGVDATLLARDEHGDVKFDDAGMPEEVTTALTEGELAIRPGWPSMFRGYIGMPERYKSAFVGEWYLSGDLAECDEDGYYWFVGRGDDVIKSAGHLIGPFEVESVLVEHPAVAEAGVIGKPDETAGEIVKAFVSLNPGNEWSGELQRELIGWCRSRLGASIAPREIDHEPALPHTRSGKIMRRLLKAWELGLPEGDLSTLEGSED